jgi:hypothetical protein
MKTIALCLCATLLAAVGTGCSFSGRVDTTAVEEAFDVVKFQNRSEVSAAVEQVKNGDYASALSTFRTLEDKYRLSTEQIVSLREIIGKLEKLVPAGAQTPRSSATTNLPAKRR